MRKKLIAITSCPTGVAHTYMAAESLEQAADKMGIDIKVETHGSVGIENKLSDSEIEEAEGLIIAADTNIEKERFVGKRIIEVSVRRGIDYPEQLIQDILDNKGKVYSSSSAKESDKESNGSSSGGLTGNIVYRALMSGVSHMIPFVVTGGLLIAVALTIGGQPSDAGFVIPEGSFWAIIESIGGAAMSFMGPVLAAYIAYSIADRPGLTPGMVGGFIAVNGSFYGSEADTGFLGAILAGFIAGYAALAVKKIPVPKAMNSVMPIIFIPIISTLIVSLVFVYLIGAPVASMFTALTSWLAGLQGANAAILGAILGAMISVDMGGPFNKTAFLFGVGLIAEGEVAVMGINAVAICIPPIAVGLAALIFRNKFNKADQSTGIAALVMGFFGITEGAIPFAAKNPLRILPSIVIGSSVGGIIAALTGVTDHVAHGGPIVAVLGAVDNVGMFFLAVAIGVAVSVALIGVLMPNMDAALEGTETGMMMGDSESADSVESTPAESANEESKEDSEVSLTDLTEKDLLIMNLAADSKNNALEELLDRDALNNIITDRASVFDAIKAREAQGSTGLGDGIAIPHAKSPAVEEARVIFARSKNGVTWGSMDGEPVHMIFLILVPEHQQGDLHLKILQMLARKLMNDDFKAQLMKANDEDEVYQILDQV